jgi:two-component system response regulator DegU
MNVVRAIETRRHRIVVADDNVAYLDDICELLEARFEIVARAANGLECVDAVRRFSPEVVVTDVSMPRMNGIEAARQITRSWPDVRVVILSAHDDPVFIETAVDAGASAYVVKLSAYQDLIPAVEEVLAGRTYIPALR